MKLKFYTMIFLFVILLIPFSSFAYESAFEGDVTLQGTIGAC